MFQKTLIIFIVMIFCSNCFGQQMVGNSMSKFMNFANNGGRLTTHNQIQYQPYVIYNNIYDADGTEYRKIQEERRVSVSILRWLGVDPQQTELFSYYRNQEKIKN